MVSGNVLLPRAIVLVATQGAADEPTYVGFACLAPITANSREIRYRDKFKTLVG
jgi:hypothetical protein